MTNFFKVILFTLLGVFALSCNKSVDEVAVTPPKPYAEQAPIDDAKIQEFFTKFHLETSAYNPLDDSGSYNVTFETADDTNPAKLSIKKQYVDTNKMQIKIVSVGGVDHKLYYLPFVNPDNDNGSSGSTLTSGKGDKPTVVDSIKVCYRGRLLDNTTFDNKERIPTVFSLRSLIQGWKEVFPLFGSGEPDTTTYASTGVTLYRKYGAGVMFMPSALGYYNRGSGTVTAYSPLIFNFKLVGVNYSDDDYDWIDSKDEAYVSPGVYNFSKDTDGDGRPDYLDQDDDGDGVTTKDEIRKPTPLLINQGTSAYYPFNPIADNPLTPTINESEPKGIPDKNGDGTTSTRLRRHLDSSAKPPYTTY